MANFVDFGFVDPLHGPLFYGSCHNYMCGIGNDSSKLKCTKCGEVVETATQENFANAKQCSEIELMTTSWLPLEQSIIITMITKLRDRPLRIVYPV